MPYPRRLFPNFLGYEGAPGSKRTLDLINDPWFGEIRVQDLPGPDGRSLADGQPLGRYAPLRDAPGGPYAERAVPLRAAQGGVPGPYAPLREAPDVMPGRPASLGGGVYSNPTTLASIGGFRTPGMGEPFRTPLTPQGREMARRAELEAGYRRNPAAARQPTASAAPTGQYEGSLGSSGTLGRTASGTHPQDRATGGRPSLADGQAQQQPGGFLSAINRWATKPLFADGRSEGMLGIQAGEHEGPGGWGGGAPPMTRIGAIGQMLSAAAAGIGATPGGGNWLGAGLAGAAGGLQQARKSEEERREKAYENEYRRLAMELKRRELEKPADLIKTSPGDILLDPTTRQPVFTAPPKTPDVAAASNPFEAAWRSLPPEQQTMEMAQKLAEQEQARKDALSPAEQAREARAEEAARRSEQYLQLATQRANQPAGAGSAPSPTDFEKAVKFRDSLPEGHPDKPAADAYVRKLAGLTAAAGAKTGAAAGKPIPSEMVGKVANVTTAMENISKLEKYYFGEGGMETGSLERWKAGKANVPGTGQPVIGTEGGGARAQMDNAIDAIIRLRTGAGLNAQEPEYYRNMYMPQATDSDETAKIKLGMLKRDLEENKRLFDAVQGKGGAQEAETSLKPGEGEEVIETDEETGKKYRLKSGADGTKAEDWEEVP